MKKALVMILVCALLAGLCACAKTDALPTLPTQNTNPTESTTATESTQPRPEYIIGGSVRESFSNWNEPAIFYSYNTETYKELLIITEKCSEPDEIVTRIACLEVQFRGLQGLEHALSRSFTGKVLAYQVINNKDAMFLHNAGKVSKGTEWQYNEDERIDLSNKDANPSATQYYLGWMTHNDPIYREHELWNRLPSGSSIILKGNMALKESVALQDDWKVYDRVLKEQGLGDIFATLES
ncbi:MAG: hypothetical protein IJO72_08050 [Oscillospiraceae bacterium]|nr:hypothetical protein [Oscillospiraceae bacterium]MBQ9930710.1 hypothetical protein [Oscillospiraceae bacterium]